MDLINICINQDSDIREGLELIDNSGLGTIFVVNSEFNIIGLLTDGDIRRALLKGSQLEDCIEDIMNKEFIHLPNDTENSMILSHLSKETKIIPLLDSKGVLVDYASMERLRRIPIASPLLDGNELRYVTDCIKTSWISSQGKYVSSFEDLFSQYHKGFESLAVSNGTVALHLAMVALGIGPGDEVIVPNFTFAASINAILYTGARPLLIDVDPITWNIDVTLIEKLISKQTKAIMPVHLYGQPCNMEEIVAISLNHSLFIIEDCAEALGSSIEGLPVGVFGDAATFSFFGNKTITTGEGGMILFKDPEIAEKARVLRDHGMSKVKRYWHELIGFNYRLTNLQAAVGVAQFERLENFVEAKKRIAKNYSKTLNKYNYFQTPIAIANTSNSYWLYTFFIDDDAPFSRSDMMNFLNDKGIESRPVFFPLSIMPPYQEFGNEENLKVSIDLSKRGISLPSSVNLSVLESNYICDCIKLFIDSTLISKEFGNKNLL